MTVERDHFQWVESVDDIRRNIVEFNRDMEFHRARAVDACGGTWYWIYDPKTKLFGTGKFVGYLDMTYKKYSKAVGVGSRGASFDGHLSRMRIEKVTGRKFDKNPAIETKLGEWMHQRFTEDMILGWAPSKCVDRRFKTSQSSAFQNRPAGVCD